MSADMKGYLRISTDNYENLQDAKTYRCLRMSSEYQKFPRFLPLSTYIYVWLRISTNIYHDNQMSMAIYVNIKMQKFANKQKIA